MNRFYPEKKTLKKCHQNHTLTYRLFTVVPEIVSVSVQ